MTGQHICIQQLLDRGEFRLEVDLALPMRGVSAVFGRSGSGKTSLLRCLAGLEPGAQGRLSLGSQIWQDERIFLPPHRRSLGYVVQTPGLFPHLDVRGNLEFARRRARAELMAFDQVVGMLALGKLLHRDVASLSGGEQQRVAIGRALLIGPELLLMDEPMASLDGQSKREILPFLEVLHRELEIPVVYVTHSTDEVARLADHLVLLDKGRVAGEGPLSTMLASLDFPMHLGDEAAVVWEGRISETDQQWGLVRVDCPGGSLWVRQGEESATEAVRLRILARDVSLTLSRHEDSSILNILPGVLEAVLEEKGQASVLVRVQVAGAPILARVTRKSFERLGMRPGLEVFVQIKSVALVH